MPRRLLAALILAAGFALFLVWDQAHWWNSRPDYAFGFLVPLFVAYVLHERRPRLAEALAERPAVLAPAWLRRVAEVQASAGLVFGLGLFALGAFYRAGAGASQPASLVMAAGFAATLLTLVYLCVPDTEPEGTATARGFAPALRALAGGPRWRAAGLFLFPALVWLVSAPVVSAVENTLSLALRDKVTAVVFFSFDMLGLPLEQRGNVLVLPLGEVGVAEACSGIRSLTGAIFAGSFLAAVFLDRWWKKAGLVAAAVALAFLTNIVRSLFLTAWAWKNGPAAIEGPIHDATGYAVLALTSLGLLALIPVFNYRLPADAVEDEEAADP